MKLIKQTMIQVLVICIMMVSCNSTEEDFETSESIEENLLDNSKKVNEKIQENFINVNGVKLHYLAKGNPKKPLLLFIHGAPERAEAWLDYLDFFSKDYYAVAYTTRGTFPSSIPKAIEAYTGVERAKDGHLLAKKLGYDEYSLITHDWGCSTGWQMAITYPNAVKKFVAMSVPHPGISSRGYHEVKAHRKKVDAYVPLIRKGKSPWNRKGSSANNFKHLRNILLTKRSRKHISSSLLHKYEESWKHDNGASIDGNYNQYKALDFPPQYLQQCSLVPSIIVKTPVLQIYGELDRFTGFQVYDLPNNDCSVNIEYVGFKDGDHWIHHEYKTEIMDKIRRFLKK